MIAKSIDPETVKQVAFFEASFKFAVPNAIDVFDRGATCQTRHPECKSKAIKAMACVQPFTAVVLSFRWAAGGLGLLSHPVAHLK